MGGGWWWMVVEEVVGSVVVVVTAGGSGGGRGRVRDGRPRWTADPERVRTTTTTTTTGNNWQQPSYRHTQRMTPPRAQHHAKALGVTGNLGVEWVEQSGLEAAWGVGGWAGRGGATSRHRLTREDGAGARLRGQKSAVRRGRSRLRGRKRTPLRQERRYDGGEWREQGAERGRNPMNNNI